MAININTLSQPACASALQVLAANGGDVMLATNDEYRPTPAISHAILMHNQGRSSRLADGIVVTPLHNPPDNGGPAGTDITAGIEAAANRYLRAALTGVKRVPYAQALRTNTTHRHDFLSAYVADIGNVIDFDDIRGTKVRIGVDPLGGADVHYWARIAETYRLDLPVAGDVVDTTLGFMTVDWDGQIRIDPSSPYAMQRLQCMKNRFDIVFACDSDHDRHGIVAPKTGLILPNHYFCGVIDYLSRNQPSWNADAAVGKTVVSTSLIDRVAARLDRKLYEVPVGFKWFSAGLLDGSLGFGGKKSSGATFLHRDGKVWTTGRAGCSAAGRRNHGALCA